MMKAKNYLFVAALGLISLLAGCQYNDVESAQSKSNFPEDGVMRFTTNLVAPTAVRARASITSDDVNQSGQDFQVKIVNPTSATYSYFNTVQYDGAEWNPLDRMLWQNDEQSITVTAAYMQDKTFSDNEFVNGANLTVAADQSSEANVKQQDLLTMPTKTIATSSMEEELLENGKLVINFYHALAKLDVTLDLANEFYKANPKLNNATDITEFTISGTNSGYTFKAMKTANENYGSVTATADTAADILANQCAFTAATDADMHSYATYEAIVVPQTIEAGALTVSFKVDTRTFSWTNSEAITLEQGKHYTLPITVVSDSDASLSITASRALSSVEWLERPSCYTAE